MTLDNDENKRKKNIQFKEKFMKIFQFQNSDREKSLQKDITFRWVFIQFPSICPSNSSANPKHKYFPYFLNGIDFDCNTKPYETCPHWIVKVPCRYFATLIPQFQWNNPNIVGNFANKRAKKLMLLRLKWRARKSISSSKLVSSCC